jgi:hypothetical protein
VVRLSALVLFLLALAACGKSGVPPASGSSPLPPFPVDKRASSFVAQKLGLETHARSADIIEDGDRVVVGPTGPGSISWVMYQLPTGGAAVEAISASIGYKGGDDHGGRWIAIADYAKQRWELHGPFGPSQGTPQLPISTDHVSPFDNVYVAIIVDNPASRYRVGVVNLYKTGANAYPVASLNITPDPGMSGRDTQASLDPSGSSDSDGTLVRYQWDFDDDGKYELETVTPDEQILIYDSADYGNKPITLRVTDDQGSIGLTHVTVRWYQNHPPVAACRLVPGTAASGAAVTLDASISSDPVHGALAQYEWDMDDDGVFEIDAGLTPTLDTTMPATRQVVGLRVTDDMGETDVMRLSLSPTKVQLDAGQGLNAEYSRVFDMVLSAGNPALLYQVSTNDGEEVRYVRALDVQGTQWGAPITLISDWVSSIDLAQIGGNPAIGYADGSELVYRVANDAAGSSWAPAVTVATGDLSHSVSLAEVAGTPALVYLDRSYPEQYLRYIRAADPQGLTWDPSVGLAGWADSYRLAEVNGAPAVAYCIAPYDWYHGDLLFVRALDPEGLTWGAPLDISNGGHDIAGLAEINGLPVMARGNSAGISFLRGLDGDGTAWGTVYSDSLPANGVAYSAANGTPLIATWAFADYTYDEKRSTFHLYSAQDVSGDSWNPPLFLDSAIPPSSLALTGITAGAGYAFVAHGAVYYDRVDL